MVEAGPAEDPRLRRTGKTLEYNFFFFSMETKYVLSQFLLNYLVRGLFLTIFIVFFLVTNC